MPSRARALSPGFVRDPDCDEALFKRGVLHAQARLPAGDDRRTVAARRAAAIRNCCLYRRTLANLLMSMNLSAEAYAPLSTRADRASLLCRLPANDARSVRSRGDARTPRRRGGAVGKILQQHGNGE